MAKRVKTGKQLYFLWGWKKSILQELGKLPPFFSFSICFSYILLPLTVFSRWVFELVFSRSTLATGKTFPRVLTTSEILNNKLRNACSCLLHQNWKRHWKIILLFLASIAYKWREMVKCPISFLPFFAEFCLVTPTFYFIFRCVDMLHTIWCEKNPTFSVSPYSDEQP